jgi:cytoskeleton protein RodZ
MASLGQALRDERESRNISIEEIATTTKIVSRYLEALEADRLGEMPGGFFVRGIIRTYAKAIGLDPEEVLDRYKAAGLLGTASADELEPPKPAPSAAPRPAPAEGPGKAAPGEPASASVAAAKRAAEKTPAGEPPEHAVQIEEAPQPRLSAAARKRIAAWTIGVLAVGIVAVVLITVWPSRHGDEGIVRQVVGTEAIPPPSQTAATETAPAAAPPAGTTARPSPQAEPGMAPADENFQSGLTIEFTFHAETWIQVRTDGELKITGLFPPGSTARAQAENELHIYTGNARGFSFLLNGRPAKPLGRPGSLVVDVKITPENMNDFLEGPSAGPSPD